MSAFLTVNDINVYYGAIHAIKGISFRVNEGEIVTLIGANGAGKSTTLKTISGVLRSKTGSIEFCGKDIGSIPAHKLIFEGIAQVPEGRHIFQQLTAPKTGDGAYSRRIRDQRQHRHVFNRFPRLRERYKQVAGTLPAASAMPPWGA
jgi:branched-chain amino acid transport system ATP-binding protein